MKHDSWVEQIKDDVTGKQMINWKEPMDFML